MLLHVIRQLNSFQLVTVVVLIGHFNANICQMGVPLTNLSNEQRFREAVFQFQKTMAWSLAVD